MWLCVCVCVSLRHRDRLSRLEIRNLIALPRSEIRTGDLGKLSGLVITRKMVLIGLDDDFIALNPDRQCVSISCPNRLGFLTL